MGPVHISKKIKRKFFNIVKSIMRRTEFFIKLFLRQKLNILISLDWNLGDEIMTIPIYKAVKEKFPNSMLSVKVRHPELFKNNPYIDMINPLSAVDHDLIFDIQKERRDVNRLDYLSRMLRITITDRIPKVYLNESSSGEVAKSMFAHNDTLKVAISAGSSLSTKLWPKEGYKHISEYLKNKYDAAIIEIGKNCESTGIGINFIDKTSIRDCIGLLKFCNLFIGNDSGLLHLALAVGIPSVGLFGPTDPAILIENTDIFCPVRSKVPCSGCWNRGIMRKKGVCPAPEHVCMKSISYEEVEKAVDELVSSTRQYRNVVRQ